MSLTKADNVMKIFYLQQLKLEVNDVSGLSHKRIVKVMDGWKTFWKVDFSLWNATVCGRAGNCFGAALGVNL